MTSTSGFQEMDLLSPDHEHIGSDTNKDIELEKVVGTSSLLTI
jgi:hypothetical protein